MGPKAGVDAVKSSACSDVLGYMSLTGSAPQRHVAVIPGIELLVAQPVGWLLCHS